MAKIKPGRQRFNTSVEVGTAYNVNTNDGESVDEKIDTYLGDRRKRLLDEAKLAELEHATEDEKTEAERARKERELLQKGKISPTSSKEEDMENTKKKVEDAAAKAAAVAAAGGSLEQAQEVGTGEAPVVVVEKPIGGDAPVEGKGWSVFNGRPVRDIEGGEYSFSQALKVAMLENPRTSNNGDKKTLAEELAEAKQKLEALGINVGGAPSTTPKPLKEQVSESVELLRTLGIQVGTSQQAPLKEQVTEAKSLLEGLGLSIGQPGESIESVREKYRHEEKLSQLTADREHKERLAGIADDFAERAGHGIGAEMRTGRSGAGAKSKSSGSNLPTVHCSDCNIDFTVAPEAKEATCPKCGAVYVRGDSVPPES